jgi:hypothetical protein
MNLELFFDRYEGHIFKQFKFQTVPWPWGYLLLTYYLGMWPSQIL